MLRKIMQKIEPISWDNHKLVTKTFIRNFNIIDSKSAYKDNKLYFRSWEIRDSFGHVKKLSQSYYNGKPIKGSQSILDIVI